MFGENVRNLTLYHSWFKFSWYGTTPVGCSENKRFNILFVSVRVVLVFICIRYIYFQIYFHDYFVSFISHLPFFYFCNLSFCLFTECRQMFFQGFSDSHIYNKNISGFHTFLCCLNEFGVSEIKNDAFGGSWTFPLVPQLMEGESSPWKPLVRPWRRITIRSFWPFQN